MFVAAVLHLAVDIVVFAAVDRNKTNAVSRTEQRQAGAERREALPAVPDGHWRAGEDLVAAGRLIGVNAGDGAAKADGASGRPGSRRGVFGRGQQTARVQRQKRAQPRPETERRHPIFGAEMNALQLLEPGEAV